MLILNRLFGKIFISLAVLLLWIMPAVAAADNGSLQQLIDEALQNNPDIKASLARIEAAKYRRPQVKSLPDPQISIGYQNEGFDRYSYGQEQGSQWMFSASQQFLFPGKRNIKEEMASRDVEALEAMHELLKLKTAGRIRELYNDLFLAHKSIDLLKGKREVYSRFEEATLLRYSTGKATRQEVLMAQTEKYMLLEREEMLKQKIQSLQAMLAAGLGRQKIDSLTVPSNPAYRLFSLAEDDVVDRALIHAPEIKYRSKMMEAAETKYRMAKKEYFPDFAISAGYYNRAGDYKDMWSASATINVPLYFASKQQPAVSEAMAGVNQTRQELEATKLMIVSAVKDNYSMLRLAEKLMDLYQNGLIPKSRQDLEQAFTDYSTGKADAASVILRLKNLLDYENLYWNQFVEREKAIARLQTITEGLVDGTEGEQKR